MYHTNGFATLCSLLAGDQLVVLGEVRRRADRRPHRAPPASRPSPRRRRCCSASPTCPASTTATCRASSGSCRARRPSPPSLVHRWVDLVGAEKFFMAYGMTEGLGLTAIRGDEWMDAPGQRRARASAAPRSGSSTTTATSCPPGEIGEIYLRSPTYGGFHYLGGAPQLADDRRRLRTVGDLGYLDDDGFLYIVDRRVDMIITGGANVFPAEVETALIDHPQIADVVVIGLTGRGVGPPGARHHRAGGPGRPADGRRGQRLRQGAPRRVQGAEDRSRSSTRSRAARRPR